MTVSGGNLKEHMGKLPLPKPKKGLLGGFGNMLKGGLKKFGSKGMASAGLGGMFKGGLKKFGLKGMAKFGGRFVPGLGQAMLAYDGLKLARRMLNKGSDSTDGNPYVVGDDPGNLRAKPEMVVPPPGSAVINNSTMTKLAKQGGGNNAAVVAAVQALGAKMDQMTAATKENSGDTVLEVDKRVFAKLSNGYFQRGGSFPVRGV